MESLLLSVLICLFYAASVFGRKQNTLQIIPEHVPEVCSPKTVEGDVVSVHYTGALESGQIFDSSLKRGEPFMFKLGEGKVIKGWDAGLLDMCVGEKRKLIIPPHLGYGSNGAPPTIPPDATLVFEAELIGIQSEPITATLMRLLRFLGMPAGAGLIVYYLYSKYNKEMEQNRNKEDQKSKKKRR